MKNENSLDIEPRQYGFKTHEELFAYWLKLAFYPR